MDFVGSLRGYVMAACVGVSAALAAVPAQALSITVDPGPAGSTIPAGTTLNLPDLLGPAADGTVTVDIFWADGKSLDFSSLDVFNLILDLDFSNASGSFGSQAGAMLDVNGDPFQGGILGTITSPNRTVNLFGGAFDPLAYGIRYHFSLTGADPGTAITAATLRFFEGGELIGQGTTQVPEPATLALFGGGVLLGFAALRGERRLRAA
jgi:hypothetical protein